MWDVDLDEELDPAGQKRIAAIVSGLAARDRLLGVKRTTSPGAQPATATDLDVRTGKEKKENKRLPCAPHLELPAGKMVHYGLYSKEVAADRIVAFPTVIINGLRTTAYSREEADQVPKWLTGMEKKMKAEVLKRGTELLSEDNHCGLDEECTRKQRRRVLKPDWTPNGDEKKQMDVDHIIELQLGERVGIDKLDQFSNYELLDASTNSSAGATLDSSIQRERRRIQKDCPRGQVPEDVFAMIFTPPVFPGGGKGAGDRWTRQQVIEGKHLAAYRRKSKPPQKKKQ